MSEPLVTDLENPSEGPRTFPPLYQGTRNPGVDRLAFFHILERLKTQKRTGWVRNNISNAERSRRPGIFPAIIPLNLLQDADIDYSNFFPSISDHMYRMSVLALCSSDPHLDIGKSVMMCVVHDLAEAQVGDIAPHEGITKVEKRRLEEEAMHNFVHEMLHNSPAAQRIEALYKEYEAGETAEARFVKDLDRFEMATQALEYERNSGSRSLQPFFDSAALPNLKHPEVSEWGKDLLDERDRWLPVE